MDIDSQLNIIRNFLDNGNKVILYDYQGEESSSTDWDFIIKSVRDDGWIYKIVDSNDHEIQEPLYIQGWVFRLLDTNRYMVRKLSICAYPKQLDDEFTEQDDEFTEQDDEFTEQDDEFLITDRDHLNKYTDRDRLNKFAFDIIKDGKMVKHYIPLPTFWTLDEEQEERYISIYKEIYFRGNSNLHLNWDRCRLIEMLVVKKPSNIYAFAVTLGPVGFLARTWIANYPHGEYIMYVHDKGNSSYYLMNIDLIDRPYTKISENQAIRHMKDFIRNWFDGKLPTMDHPEFFKSVLQRLKLSISIDSDKVKKTV